MIDTLLWRSAQLITAALVAMALFSVAGCSGLPEAKHCACNCVSGAGVQCPTDGAGTSRGSPQPGGGNDL